MSNEIPTCYVDVITYPCPNPDGNLANPPSVGLVCVRYKNVVITVLTDALPPIGSRASAYYKVVYMILYPSVISDDVCEIRSYFQNALRDLVNSFWTTFTNKV